MLQLNKANYESMKWHKENPKLSIWNQMCLNSEDEKDYHSYVLQLYFNEKIKIETKLLSYEITKLC